MAPPIYHIKNLTKFDIVVAKHTSSTLLCSVAGVSHPGERSLTVRVSQWKQLAAKTGSVKWHEVQCTFDEDEDVKSRPWRRRRGRDSEKSAKPSQEANEKTGLLWKKEMEAMEPPSPITRPPLKAYYRRHCDGSATILFLPRLVLDAHLSDLSDETSIGDLVIPGTHNSLALHGWPISKCQDSECLLDVQLQEGIRFFDIRLSVKRGVLLAYHGPFPQRVPFTTMLAEFSTFLRLHPRETLIMCVQQEVPSNSLLFSSLVRQAMDEGIRNGEWWLENRIPLLGEVRGRGILMARFGGSKRDGGTIPWRVNPPGGSDSLQEESLAEEVDDVDEPHYYEGESFAIPPRKKRPSRSVTMGWRPETWPDSVLDGFVWHCSSTPCRTQDCQLPTSSNLTLSFASAASIPFALPPFVANGFGWPSWGLGLTGVNQRLKDWLLDCLNAEGQDEKEVGVLRGIVPMDFYRKADLVDVMIAFNSQQNSKRCSQL
ncbi:hypothetical protein QFC21_003800 [Naganishia friedmannii]|uniref:Uncharacterized protein n=1 Tax=Naganishia friedmannii TaxID=89922 RepID=A0ACC2VL21_9TREE|nr:hypothetical protein QFC21_003800 [Naganishia friedmannii]